MKNIFAHIAGVNLESKELIKKSFSKKIFEIIDLDIITEKIINDKNMLYLYNRDEFYKNKLKDQNLSKLNIKQINNIIKKIDQKMNLYWKANFDNAITNLISKIDKLVIVIGYNTYFKNHKIYVNINTNHKYIKKVNLIDHAKNVVSTNLKEYYEDIINGDFPLEYLNHQMIIKKRNNLVIQYQKMEYQLDTINNIINAIEIAYNTDIPNMLYFASKENFNKKIMLKHNKIIAYEDQWIALISALSNNNISKGYSSSGQPYVKCNPSILNIPIYLYLITDTKSFSPIPTKNKLYKYQSAKQITIDKKVLIDNIHDKLKELKINIK
jgi:nicotinamide mononucleotide adenylyltransferase